MGPSLGRMWDDIVAKNEQKKAEEEVEVPEFKPHVCHSFALDPVIYFIFVETI